MKRRGWYVLLSVGIVGAMLWGAGHSFSSQNNSQVTTLTNVSYDPTREFYEDIMPIFQNIIKNEPVRM